MITSRELTTKQKILDVIQRMPEEGTIDDAIYRLGVLKAVAEGLQDTEEGRVYDHDEVFDELLSDHAQHPNPVDRPGKNGSRRAKATDRKGHAKKSTRVPPKAKAGRK